MFNNSGFNRAAFNREFTVDVMFSAVLNGEGGVSTQLSAEYTASIVINGEGTLSTDFIREVIVRAAVMDGEGTLTAANLRERLTSALLSGEGTLTARPKKFHAESITITGPFAPGQKVVIDTRNLRVTKNGTHTSYSGDFFDIHPGDNTVTYSDTAAGRAVQIRITRRDRYL